MVEVKQHRDLRSEWDNSPELKRSIKDELENWAHWSHDAGTSKYAKQPWYTPPRDQRDKPMPPPPCDVKLAEETEGFFRLWRTIARAADPRTKHHLATLIVAVKLHYLTGKSAQTKAKILSVSRREFYRLLDEAEYRYWVIART